MGERDTILPLRLDGVRFAAAGATLLEATVRIERGGLTAIIGPNGAGKSLLLRLGHGLITPSEGAVSWGAPGGVREGRKRHALVFQKPIMLRRSARENLLHALRASGLGAQAPARADEALARFGLAGLADRPARQLSGGEQQRLAIARAWALAPDVLFLDEPTSALDPGATRQIETMLSQFKADGMTLVMATHDLAQARRLADRVLFVNRGRIVEDAPAERFFNTPDAQDAQAFLKGDLLW